jgi:thioredoxin 1
MPLELNITEWLTKKDFLDLSESPAPQMVLFAANWCGYCSRFLGIVRGREAEAGIRMNVVDVDDPDESLWDDFRIKLVPTLVVFKSGEQIFRRDAIPGIGLRSQDLEDAVRFLSSPS